jgi:hypothetical protein
LLASGNVGRLTRRRRLAPTQPAKTTLFAGGRLALSAEIAGSNFSQLTIAGGKGTRAPRG